MNSQSLSPATGRKLLSIARGAIAAYLKGDPFDPQKVAIGDPALSKEQGVFVTLYKGEALRGCIGLVESGHNPLFVTVAEMARAAAFQDPRFPPLTGEEWPHIAIEVSILSPFLRVKNPEEVKPGVHGVMISCHGRRGLYLPQVATEYGWDRQQFLTHLCAEKMGIPGDSWKRADAEIYIFTTEVYTEG